MVVPAEARSWIAVDPESHFPIQNLPYGTARIDGRNFAATRIGNSVVDLNGLHEAGLLTSRPVPSDFRAIREAVFELLREENGTLRDDARLRDRLLYPVSAVEMRLPMPIPAFVDFYSGIHHASNVGRMFRPEMAPLLPNYRHLPVGYNGRASSVVVSGTPIRRPNGQVKAPEVEAPTFGPTQELDFELELGFFIGEGNALGEPIMIDKAEEHILGLVLVNDWSARDVQRWEYQPLGPFLAKSFGTSISPWLVALDALEPFRIKGRDQDPPVLPHLRPLVHAHYDIHLEVAIQSVKMARPQVISRSNARHLYWSFVQQLAHQTSNGTNTETGDLYASGTISGPEAGSFGSLLELTWRGRDKLHLEETGEDRTFLEDGDTVLFTGYGQAPGFRVGFGELSGTIQP